jgi:hypothetical protein
MDVNQQNEASVEWPADGRVSRTEVADVDVAATAADWARIAVTPAGFAAPVGGVG